MQQLEGEVATYTMSESGSSSDCEHSPFSFSLYPQSCPDAFLNGYMLMFRPHLNLFSIVITDMP